MVDWPAKSERCMTVMDRVRLTRALARHLSPIFVAALAFLFLHGGLSKAIAAVPYQDISSAGPLSHIYVGADASVQIAHVGDPVYEFYPEDTFPGDAGTFLVVNDALYAPNFAAHDDTASGISGLDPYTPFTPVSQTSVTGSGTAADPYRVVTVVDAGTTGLRITQTDSSYIVGQESYRTDVQISNSGAASQNAILYRAGDCYLAGVESH